MFVGEKKQKQQQRTFFLTDQKKNRYMSHVL